MFHKTRALKERVKRRFLTFCNNSNKGFTLVELLIVIGILAALSAAVVVVINPTEMLRQGRDSTRMREINSIHRALSMFQVDRPSAPIGDSNRIHVSIPDTSDTCANLGLPTLPSGWAYHCVTAENLRKIDGTGWIPVDFTTMFQGSPLSHLPIDPTNIAASSNFYVFVTDGRTWTFASLLESERHAPSALRDGGTDSARFEVGNNLSLWTSASGLVGYWSFDGTGSIANNQIAGLRDESGRGNHGTASNANATGMAFVPGRVGNAVTLDGVDDFVRVPHSANLDTAFGTNTVFTLEAWVFPIAWTDWDSIMNKARGSCGGHITNGIWTWGGGFFCAMGSGVAPAECNPPGSFIATHARVSPLNSWSHIVCTADGTDLIMYVDGREIGGRAAIAGLTHPRSSNTEPLVIGGRAVGWGPNFNGNIDEIRIHNRALTEAEIRASFNATR